MNNILSQLLTNAMGLNLTSISKVTLQNALHRRRRALKLDSEALYIAKLQSSPREISKLIDEVVVNETWFFRDKAPFDVLKNFARAWIQKNIETPMRLLSIPCSTGEEPYSIAITLLEAGLHEKNFSINAIDISKKSLEFADKAVYRKRSFRGVDKTVQSRYFRQINKGYSLNNKIKKTVRFARGNLVNLTLPLPFWGYNVIFCRNLLIYLDTDSQKQAISTLHRLLTDDGLLFIGHAEPGLFTDSPFTPAPHPKAFSFIKKKDIGSTPIIDAPTQFHAASDNSNSSAPHHRNFTDSDQLIQAQVLAGQGKSDQAIELCEQIIKNNKPAPQVFMLLGIIFDEKQDLVNAVKMLKKAIYLNPNFIDALELLSNIYKRLSDEQNQRATLRRISRVKDRLNAARAQEKGIGSS